MNEFLPFAHAAHAVYPPQQMHGQDILMFLALILTFLLLLLYFAPRNVVTKRMLERRALLGKVRIDHLLTATSHLDDCGKRVQHLRLMRRRLDSALLEHATKRHQLDSVLTRLSLEDNEVYFIVAFNRAEKAHNFLNRKLEEISLRIKENESLEAELIAAAESDGSQIDGELVTAMHKVSAQLQSYRSMYNHAQSEYERYSGLLGEQKLPLHLLASPGEVDNVLWIQERFQHILQRLAQQQACNN